jgi:hypothetical protein
MKFTTTKTLLKDLSITTNCFPFPNHLEFHFIRSRSLTPKCQVSHTFVIDVALLERDKSLRFHGCLDFSTSCSIVSNLSCPPLAIVGPPFAWALQLHLLLYNILAGSWSQFDPEHGTSAHDLSS